MKITIEITDIQIACIKAHIDDLAQSAITAAEFNLAQIAYQIESEYDRKIRRIDSKQNPIIYGDSEAKSPTMESTNTDEPSTTSNAQRSKKRLKTPIGDQGGISEAIPNRKTEKPTETNT